MFSFVTKLCLSSPSTTCITPSHEVFQNPQMKLNAFLIACCDGNLRLVNRLLHDKEFDPTAFHNEGFRSACANGHYELVFLLLQDSRINPADGPNYFEGNTALKMAALNNHWRIVELLLEDPRVDPSADNDFALRVSCLKGHDTVVSMLLKHPKVNPSARSTWMANEPLRMASWNGQKNIVRMLMSHPKVNPMLGKKTCSKDDARDLLQSISEAVSLAQENQHEELIQVFRSFVSLELLPKPKGVTKLELNPTVSNGDL